MNKSGVNINL